jgi:hypothetical protein
VVEVRDLGCANCWHCSNLQRSAAFDRWVR